MTDAKEDDKHLNLMHINENEFYLNCYNNTDEKPTENAGACYHDMSVSYNRTSNNEENVTKEIFLSQDKKKRQELDVTRTKSFKSFSRQYILQKLLHVLHSESDDSKSAIYKNYLLKVEAISEDLCNGRNGNICNDLVAALENAYYLHTHSIGKEILNASDIRSFPSERQICSSDYAGKFEWLDKSANFSEALNETFNATTNQTLS